MKEKDDKIKNLFSSKLDNFEADVPAAAWVGISAVLAQGIVATAAAASAATTASSTAASTAAVASTGSQSLTAATAVAVKTKIIIAGAVIGTAATLTTAVLLNQEEEIPHIEPKVEYVEVIEAEEPVVEEVKVVKKQAVQQEIILPTISDDIEESFIQIQEITPYVEDDELVKDPAVMARIDAENTLEQPEGDLLYQEELLPKPIKKKDKIRFSLGARFSVSALNSKSTETGSSNSLFSSHKLGNNAFSFAGGDETKLNIKHNQPISIGLIVGVDFNKRWSLETGLVYTRLSSKITSSGLVYVDEKLKIDYLGVPVNLNYNFYTVDKLSFYTSVGVMLQTDVNGHFTSRVGVPNLFAAGAPINPKNTNFVNAPSIRRKINQPHVQFSARALLGVSFPVYRSLYIYGNVGGAYYFDAKNKYKTIYSDKKFQLDLDLGLKWKF